MPNNFFSMLQQLKSNPVQFLVQRKFNIPSDVATDPNSIMQYLMNTGQVTQQQINNAYQAARSIPTGGAQRR